MDRQSSAATSPQRRNFLSKSASSVGGRIGSRGGVFGIQQKLKALKQVKRDTLVEQQLDSDNNNEMEHNKIMNGVNNNHEESELLDLKIKGRGSDYDDNSNGQIHLNGNGVCDNGDVDNDDEGEYENGEAYKQDNEYGDEEDDNQQQEEYEDYNGLLMQQHLQRNGDADEEEQEYQEDEEDYYPDISEYLTTQIDGVADDEEDRGVPPQQNMPNQHGYYYDDDEDEVDVSTAQLLNSLPPGTLIQQTSSKPSSSTSARTNTLLNNFLLRNNVNRNGSSRSSQQYNSVMMLNDNENNDEDDSYYDDEGSVPLSLIVQQAKIHAQQHQQQAQKRPAMNKPRTFRQPPLSTSALLEQLQSPAFTKPNILSRKLMGLPTRDNSNARPPPRLQPKPQRSLLPSSAASSSQQISLESILRKHVSSKPVPRLQNLSSTTSSRSPSNYIIEGRKLSFKTGNASIMKQQRAQQKSPTRSLESLMLSHQRSTQLQQQLSSGRNLRGEQEILLGNNLHIRHVTQPQQTQRSPASLLRNHQQQQQKNVPRCHICKKTFATNQVLQRHIASVHGVVLPTGDGGELKISASIFGGAQQQLQQQQLQQQQQNSSAHRCRVCYRTFGSLESLRAHSLNHEGEFKCRACRRGFPSWEVLEQHEATHKKYECRWCEKYFMNSGNLKAHERIHTGERPYKCADCPKGFKQLGGLQYHLKTNPTHRPQKYKLEDQEQDNNSPQDYSGTMYMGQEDGSDGNNGMMSYMDDEDDNEEDQQGATLMDYAAASAGL